jgi:flagellar protein FlaG
LGLTAVGHREEAMMETGLTTRPTGTPTQMVVRPEPAPARQTVATELAPSQSVTASAESANARNDGPNNALLKGSTSREFVLDAQSREMIFRVVDVRSGRVVRQVPDEAMMRLRAYNRALANGESPAEAQSDTQA